MHIFFKKSFLLLIFVMLSTSISMGRTLHSADSLLIIGFQYDKTLETHVNRFNFLDIIHDLKVLAKRDNSAERNTIIINSDNLAEFKDISYVDTLVTLHNNVAQILKEISELEKIKKMPFDANHYYLKNIYSHQETEITWIPIETLEYRLLIVIFKRKKLDFVWLDANFAEYGNYRYKISDNLRKALSKYTHLYDSYLRQ